MKPLTPSELRRRCDPEKLPFSTTDELAPLVEPLGQARALEALRFGASIHGRPYHVYAMGRPGVGRHWAIRADLEQRAKTEPVPPDWVYASAFHDDTTPRALSLPAGRGLQLKHDVDELQRVLAELLPAAVEGDDFRARKEALEEEVRRPHEAGLMEVGKEAEKRGLALVRTPNGLTVVPVRDGEPLPPDEFQKLDPEKRDRLQHDMERIHEKLHALVHHAPEVERERKRRVRALVERECATLIASTVDPIRRKFQDLPAVVHHLQEMQQDMALHADEFVGGGADKGEGGASPLGRRYRINVIVDNSALGCAPVIYEDDPRLSNLVGSAEHVSIMGTLHTDFTLLRGGALHRANGGYLILDVRKLLQHGMAWDALKRALHAGSVTIESPAQALGLVSTQSLRPDPVPLHVKVVLLGDRLLYHLLCEHDPEFLELFKIVAEFDDEVPWDPDEQAGYARLLGALVKQEKLRPLDRTAVARVLEHAARQAGDSGRLSVHMRATSDLVREVDEVARQAGASVVTRVHVERALDAREARMGRVKERILDQIREGTVLIDTEGQRVGQVNGLSVIQVGEHAFGRPVRISARTRLGRGHIMDIEREAELAGPIHSKGVLILQGYLGARYARERPLPVSASLVFEQSYSGIEGDSASAAELFALLSDMAGVPLTQELAVTGSINQHGGVQAIGGVNEKIEGFFDVCQARGLTGRQGVIIPRANVRHLMLRRDVISAASEGRFSVFAIEHVDEGLELLTGMAPGEVRADGTYPEGTFNERLDRQVRRLSELAQKFGRGAEDDRSRDRKAAT